MRSGGKRGGRIGLESMLYSLKKKKQEEAGVMAQLLRGSSTLAEGPSLVPSTHVKRFATVWNSTSRRFGALLWLPGTCTCTHTGIPN